MEALTSSASTLYAGYDGDCMYRSTNKGEIWTKIDSGLTSQRILSLHIAGLTLYARTFSSSVFKIFIDTTSDINVEYDAQKHSSDQLTIAPNPTNNDIQITYNIGEKVPVSELYFTGIHGSRVMDIDNVQTRLDEHKSTVNTSSLVDGIYMVVLRILKSLSV